MMKLKISFESARIFPSGLETWQTCLVNVDVDDNLQVQCDDPELSAALTKVLASILELRCKEVLV